MLIHRALTAALATVDAARARLSCAPQLNVKTDGPLDLRIDCTKAAKKTSCASSVSFKLPRVKGARITSAVVKRGNRVVTRKRSRNLRSLTVKRTSEKAYNVRIELKTSERGQTLTLIRRVSAC